ncbi:MAG TPA: hypothetical protein VGS07_20840 [Thermoanaerobaculia bacterium]|jgi:hypothetical protein|nr:hypothetical protein [Thermoanaerobaculia bacterium]
MKRCLLAAIVLGIALLAPVVPAALSAAVLPPRLVFEAPPRFAPAVSHLRAAVPPQLGSVMRLTGLTDPGPPIRVVLAPEGSPEAGLAPRWVVGYALGDQGLIVLLPERVPSYPDSSLDDVLLHETAHVLVARAAAGRPLPRWFQEGMAMIAGRSWGLDDRTRLTLALLVDRPVSLAALDGQFARGQAEVNRAYSVAGSFVRDLLDRYGPGAAPAILEGVAHGLSFEDAFFAATGTSLAGAEDSFWSRQTFWYRWVPVLTSSVTLWLLITLLALWAIRHRRRRDAAQRRIWEEEEARERERLRLAAAAAAALEGPGPEGWVN